MGRVVIPGFRKIETSGGGEGGTTNYNDLTNKPFINNVPLVGNLRTVDLKLTDATLTEEGVPAEAKTVGAKVKDINSQIAIEQYIIDQQEYKVVNNKVVPITDIPPEDYQGVSDFSDRNSKNINTIVTAHNKVVDNITEVQKRISDNGYGEVAGGKNLMDISDTTYTETLTDIAWSAVLVFPIELKSGTYSLSFLSDKSYTTRLQLKTDIWNNFGDILKESKDNEYLYKKSFVLDNDTTGQLYVQMKLNTGNTVNCYNIQIEEGSVATSYEPYFPSNKMLAEEKADKSETTVNLLNPTLQTTTINGITCTNNGDGTYTLNGTANGTATFILKDGFNCSQFVGMKLVGCPSEAIVGGVRKFAIVMQAATSPWNTNADDIGNGSIIVGPSGNSNLFIVVYEGATLDNLVFKPMITTNLDATYDDFVPYTGSTGQINSDVAYLLKRIEALESLTNKTDTTTVETE